MQSLSDTLGVPHTAHPEQEVADRDISRLSAKQFAKQVLSSREYRSSLMRRVVTDTLPAAVEIRLYDYAYGKPVERHEVKDTTEDPLWDAADVVLHKRLQYLADLVSARQLAKTVDAPEHVEPAVH
jgi:hypothetical protein